MSLDEESLCACNRPDELENPHRHERDAGCGLWEKIEPEVRRLYKLEKMARLMRP